MAQSKTAIIIGAGPAGLTAAYELLARTDCRPIVLERSQYLGGISRTITYKGNRMDIGGHRFFSKSDRVMDWWLRMLPLQAQTQGPQVITYERQTRVVNAPLASAGPGDGLPGPQDRIMLFRRRRSRIYFMRKFFDYPITLSGDTIRKLGLRKTLRIGLSYARAVLRPIRNEQNLEQFFINRFGRELYRTFFQSYTEKVWGVPCDQISAAWGAQRVKGLSISRALWHVIRRRFRRHRNLGGSTETSLIEQFLYPNLGPGQMWEVVAEKVTHAGGEIRTGWQVRGLRSAAGPSGPRITAVRAVDLATGREHELPADLVFSTMPIQELVRGLDPPAPPAVRRISDGLVYRDFIAVGLLLNELRIREPGSNGALIRDNWIYIQEPDVKLGRVQIFNNWSPHLVADPTKIWLGLEYFCYQSDSLWQMPDAELVALAIDELHRIGMIDKHQVVDAHVVRMEKTYPAYFGTYDQFDRLREYFDAFENLYLIGRNGMHRYNNQDHSMLAAMVAVDNLVAGRTDRGNIWSVNAEAEYHEERPK